MVMNKRKWIAVIIAIVVVILSLGLIKIMPFWVTLFSLLTFCAGAVAGYLFNSIEKPKKKE